MTGDKRELEWLRRQFVIALAANDELYDLLILKGGNALVLAHKIGMRTSMDFDYSLAEEVEDSAALGKMIEHALVDHLSREKITVFDWKFTPRPRVPKEGQREDWGGYLGVFKVIDTSLWEKLDGEIESVRKQAWGIIDTGRASKSFRIELSRNEFCEGAGAQEIGDGFQVRVYTPAMIAVEKLRSLCQQMPEYGGGKRAARARDFYDIHAVTTDASVDLLSATNADLIRAIFEVKGVPIKLLGFLARELAFHEGSWEDVRDSIPAGRPREFGYYANFVVGVVRKLESLWKENTP